MRLFAKYVFLWLCLLGLGNVSLAQNINYPVTVTPFFSPNYSTQWSEFYGERLLKVSIIIKDNAQLSGNVKVFARFSLERVGITIQNPADFVPTKGTPLSFGNQVTLSGADLSESFLPQNLVVSGIDDAIFRQGGSLPDGLWTFRITLYEFDAARGYRQISNQGICNMSVFLGQPPLLLFPAKDSEIDSKYIPNVLFQWMPRATSAEGGMASIAYTFQLWQLGDDENENDVGTGKNPVYEETVNSPFLNYDASKTPLIAGKNYAWRVTVKDLGGNNAYENKGQSEVWKFRYGISCKAPTGLSITNVGNGMREIAWDLMPEAASYELRWRQEPKNEEQTKNTTLNYVNMLLSSEDIYHFEVRTLCKNAENSPWSETVDYGQIQTSKGASPTAKSFASGSVDNSSNTTNDVFDPANIVVSGSEVDPTKMDALTQELNSTPNPTEQRCGVSVVNNSSSCETPATSTYSGTTPFTSLVNSTIYINGYDIRITKVNDNGSGEGLLFFPYLGRRIPVEWNGNTIVKGEGEYGCITTGIVQAQGSDASILTNDLQRQIAALYNNLNEPGSYSGTFGQAIEAMKTLATELATKGTIDKNDPILTKFKSVCSAVNKGTQQWINEINEKVGSNPTQETTALIAAIASAKTKVLEMLDCGNANNSNATPVVPKKGPAWDDRFLIADCNYANAQLGADELVTQIDNNKVIFTPPPTNKLTCIVKLSELKTQLGSAINTFVCPDGGLITLADADEIAFYSYDKSWYPNGSILGIKKGNKNYIVRIFKSGSGLNFTGFVDYDSWKANGYAPNTSFHSNAPTLNQDLQVWAIEQSEDQQVRAIGIANYRALSYTQGAIEGDKNRLNYILEQTASSCNFINNAKDATPKDSYSSQAGLEDLKTKLNTYEGLGDVVFKVTDKAGKTSYVTKSKIYKPEDAFPKPTNATIFEITEDADGKVDVGGTFKADPTCATCAGAAQTALTAALENMKAKHGGKIDPKKNVIEGSDFNINAGLAYQNMSLGEALAAMAKGYNSLIENAKVPTEVWEPNKAFPVKDNWGVVTGGIDGAITEGTDKAQLVGMVLTVISNPKKTATDVAKFAKGAVSSWDNAKSLITTLGQGIVGYDASDFEEGKHAVYKGRGIGKVGGTLAVQAMSGGGLLAIIQNAPDQLDNLATRIANLLNKLRAKLKTLNWSDADIEYCIKDFDGLEGILAKIDANKIDPQAWKFLRNGPNKLKEAYLHYLSNPDAVDSWNTVKNANIESKYPNLPVENITSIYHYTTEAYYDLNKALRDGTLTEYLRSFNNVLNESLSQLPKYTQATYRGTAISEVRVLQKYKTAFLNGTKSIEEAFMSTSKDFNVAQSFADDVLQGDDVRVFFTVEGKNGVDIENISAYGPTFDPNYSESEILFKSNSSFSVTGFSQDLDINGNKIYLVTLKE